MRRAPRPSQLDGELDQNLTDEQQNGLRTNGLMTADTLTKLGVPIQ